MCLHRMVWDVFACCGKTSPEKYDPTKNVTPDGVCVVGIGSGWVCGGNGFGDGLLGWGNFLSGI